MSLFLFYFWSFYVTVKGLLFILLDHLCIIDTGVNLLNGEEVGVKLVCLFIYLFIFLHLSLVLLVLFKVQATHSLGLIYLITCNVSCIMGFSLYYQHLKHFCIFFNDTGSMVLLKIS